MKKAAVLLIVLLFAFGCKGRSYHADPMTADTGSAQVLTEDTGGGAKDGGAITESDVPGKSPIEGEEGGIYEITSIPSEIFFDYDRYDVRQEAVSTLTQIADYLLNQSSDMLIIEGHCDDRGTNEYNLALGDRRASSARDYLIAQGVPPARIETISYGEENPVCTAQTENCWSRNRRDHFYFKETGR